MAKENSVLVMLSGGKDSLLSACLTLEQGAKIYAIKYDNGCMTETLATVTSPNGDKTTLRNIDVEIAELSRVYGADRVVFLGVHSIAGIFRDLRKSLLNKSILEIGKEYGNMSFSQATCLACKSAMYAYSIAMCHEYSLSSIVDGVRTAQGFFVDTDIMVGMFKNLCRRHGVSLRTPVLHYDMNSYDMSNEILVRGFNSVRFESKCLLGMPLEDGEAGVLSVEEKDGLLNYYNKDIAESCTEWVGRLQAHVRVRRPIIESGGAK